MPGAYTVRITLVDALDRTNFLTRLIQVGDLTGPASLVAEAARGARNPYARGSLAVWQDQSDGNWEIYAQDLRTNGASILKLTETALNQENPRTDGRFVVWQGRQPNGTWDVYIKDMQSSAPPRNLTGTATRDEINPAVHWPWVVYQARSTDNPNAPWQLRAWNAITEQITAVSPSQQDQLDPEVRDGRVVWQDFRDVGFGEIYYRHLETGDFRRITANQFGQYHPVIEGHWIVWQDNRHGQVELYGYDFRREIEVRLTNTPEDESLPFIEGEWVICQETSLGSLTGNLRLLHLPTRYLVPVTRSVTYKTRPALAGRVALWQEAEGNAHSIRMAELPSLQGVFENPNTVVVTPALAMAHPQVFSLLTLWQQQVGVIEISRFTALAPAPVRETASWNQGSPAGINFPLTPGSFLWVKFPAAQVVDLGINAQAPIQLNAGLNVVTYDKFPANYSAFRLLRQLGANNVRAVRMLDAEQGRWAVAEMRGGVPLGEDFLIPKVAVLMLDLTNPVANFQP
jgi:beta propeller repeat protein